MAETRKDFVIVMMAGHAFAFSRLIDVGLNFELDATQQWILFALMCVSMLGLYLGAAVLWRPDLYDAPISGQISAFAMLLLAPVMIAAIYVASFDPLVSPRSGAPTATPAADSSSPGPARVPG